MCKMLVEAARLEGLLQNNYLKTIAIIFGTITIKLLSCYWQIHL